MRPRHRECGPERGVNRQRSRQLAHACIDGKRAALIVVSLGTNDALASDPQGKQKFADRYGVLLTQLSALTPRLVVLQIPPVGAQGQMIFALRDEAMRAINEYNSVLPDLAKRGGAAFMALPTMSDPYTIDGVHLNTSGYLAWDQAVLQGAAMICQQN
jgi:lysophospholipase L1-like esterase